MKNTFVVVIILFQTDMGCSDSKTKESINEAIVIEYFDFAYGRCEPIRFLLSHAKVDYKFIGYDLPTWKNMKAQGKSGEFGGLPRVTTNGEELGQSLAILRMFGAKYGYYPTNDWKTSFYINVILDCWEDMLVKTNTTTFVLKEMSQDE